MTSPVPSTHYFPLDLEYTVSCIIIVMKIGEGNKKQYWTITEMAELSGYDAMTLRYYERIGIIEPVSRVNGRRHIAFKVWYYETALKEGQASLGTYDEAIERYRKEKRGKSKFDLFIERSAK